MSDHLPVSQHLSAHDRRHCETKKERQRKQRPSPTRSLADDHGEARPHESEGEDQPQVSSGTRISYAPCPTQLMRKESSKGIGGKMCDYDSMRELNREAKVSDALAQLVVVGELVDKRFETAN